MDVALRFGLAVDPSAKVGNLSVGDYFELTEGDRPAPDAAARYQHRCATIEPVFASIEHDMDFRRSSSRNEDTIVAELNKAQGGHADIGGYYYPDREKTTAVMRPSKTFNTTLEAAQG